MTFAKRDFNSRRVAFALCACFVASCKNRIESQSPRPEPTQTPAPVQPPMYAPAEPSAVSSAVPDPAQPPAESKSPKQRVLDRYDSLLGQQLAQRARSSAGGTSQGLCYLYVGRALEAVWPRGFHDSGDCSSTDLNCRIFARSFAEHWKSSVHAAKLRLEAVLLKSNLNGETKEIGFEPADAPAGSVLVWKSCSSNPAGHIAIVTKKGQEAASDFMHGLDVCPRAGLIGIFIPVKP